MKNRSKTSQSSRTRSRTVRASVTFPANVYRALEDLAKRNKVSVAWVVRDAAEKYVADKKPASGAAS